MSLKNIDRASDQTDPYIHPTALIEECVLIGSCSCIWDHVHIRRNTSIGNHTTIGEKTYVAYDVVIGSYVKINAMVYICAGVQIEDQCMISAGVVFTNDLFPRAMNKELTDLESALPTEDTLYTLVKQGATLGANATIGPGLEIGSYAMVGMGSVVTHDVPSQALVVGNPARLVGYVCLCGPKLIDIKQPPKEGEKVHCARCQRVFTWKKDHLIQ